MIELRLGPDTEKLRTEFLSWLKSNPPPELPPTASLDEFVATSAAFQGKLAAERWVGVHWPAEFGGRGLSIAEEAVLQGELARARAPQLVGLFGLTMVGPVLLKHGTDEHRKRFLKRILSAEDIWCQGFSEPDAGSDLASLKTQAVAEGGAWKITGQQIWTSFAQHAKWCFVLARTDVSVPKHKGLTYFLVEMSSPGIDVRPLKQITGEEEFNEVFFDGVPVPGDLIVGQPGQGWEIAIATLMYERVVLTFARHLQSEQALDDIRILLLERTPTERELIRYGELQARSMAVRALALSHLITYDANNPPGPEGSLDKLGWSETFQEICKFALELLGPRGVRTQVGDRWDLMAHRYLYSRGRTIAAGTSEIQRNIIAERVLGLQRG